MAARNTIIETEPTWVSITEAARYAGVGRAVIERAIDAGELVARSKGRGRVVPLEAVLTRTIPTDLELLRARIERAASWQDAPAAVREWGASMLKVVVPLLDRLRDAEARAALAEARLDAAHKGVDALGR